MHVSAEGELAEDISFGGAPGFNCCLLRSERPDVNASVRDRDPCLPSTPDENYSRHAAGVVPLAPLVSLVLRRRRNAHLRCSVVKRVMVDVVDVEQRIPPLQEGDQPVEVCDLSGLSVCPRGVKRSCARVQERIPRRIPRGADESRVSLVHDCDLPPRQPDANARRERRVRPRLVCSVLPRRPWRQLSRHLSIVHVAPSARRRHPVAASNLARHPRSRGYKRRIAMAPQSLVVLRAEALRDHLLGAFRLRTGHVVNLPCAARMAAP